MFDNIRKRLAGMGVAVLLMFGVGVAAADMAAASPTATAMVQTQRMAGPTLNTNQLGWYGRGQGLTLSCYARGQSVQGYYSPWVGWDNLWYQTSDGGWVADVDINTGSNNPVTGACSTGTREQRAVAWANSMVGSNAYPGLCELFVENAFNTSGRYPSAIAAFNALQSAGQMHYSSTGIPAGALVFSSNPAYDSGYGHVMLSRGDGTFVSGGAGSPSVKIYSTPNPGSTFLGWAYAPSSWPSR